MSLRRLPPDKKRMDVSTAEDRALWHKVAGTIKPLAGRKNLREPAPAPKGTDIYIPPTEVQAPRPRQPLATLSPTGGGDVDGALLKRLRAGELPIAGRIDLHGMTRAEAEAALTRFIHFSFHNGRRCVLVITGRSGILKPATLDWLNGNDLRSFILAIAPAKNHGGAGAFYVLLKRRK